MIHGATVGGTHVGTVMTGTDRADSTRANLTLSIAIIVLFGTSIAVLPGLLSPFASGLLFGAGAAAAVLSAGQSGRRNHATGATLDARAEQHRDRQPGARRASSSARDGYS